jgi:carbamoyltransferase
LRILGLSAFYHDSAAALIEDGRIVAAAQEERFTRKKHDARMPRHAVNSCLKLAGVELSDVDVVAFYEKPFVKFERLLETYAAMAPVGFTSFRQAVPLWIKEKLFQKDLLARELKSVAPDENWADKLVFSEHHLSHAASAFFPSPFENAAVLTMDGVGEWTTTSLAFGSGSELEIQKEIHFPHSLGLLYSAFTYYTGFKVNSGEYKVMGLAPYGAPRFAGKIYDNLMDLKADGTFRLDQRYFNYCTGLTMTSERFHDLFGAPPRKPNEPLTQFHMDLAASVQTAVAEAVLRLARSVKAETGAKNLCLAGGVALNCVANGKILREGIFENLWIQPAAGDAGGALGAALAAYHIQCGGPRTVPVSGDAMAGSLLGPLYNQGDIEHRLKAAGAVFTVYDEAALVSKTAAALAANQAVGWFQGRMEFGPRALGARSIIANPAAPDMQSTLNLKVKYRESFRPFAPAVLREDVSEWFDLACESPYMLLVASVRDDKRLPVYKDTKFGIEKLNVARSQIPAVTHVDYSARVQTVTADINPRFHALLSQFKLLTGIPVLVNTSFNVRSEPIVCTPEDAFRCFMATELDLLVIGDCILRKEDQDTAFRRDYSDTFELD